jgi:ABC-type polysaccharide/polyol phosphate export permease
MRREPRVRTHETPPVDPLSRVTARRSLLRPSSPPLVVPTGQMLRTLVERQLRLQVKRSFIGLVWPAVGPFFLFGLYLFVFHTVFKVPVKHYPEYLFAGLLPWTFLAQSLSSGIGSISSESDLVRRARFRYELLPMASVAMTGLYFFADLAVFIVYLAAVGRVKAPVLALLPVCICALALLAGGLAMVLALIDVYNRDLRRILGNLLTVWFFLLPIVYRPNMVPHTLHFLRSVDPMNIVIAEFREVLYGRHFTRPAHLVEMFALCAVLFVLCLSLFRRLSVDLPKDV